ncbi:MAG: diguanylate cyclase, partial [Burkholderiales bacterium]|nr:diguanylate cyclase [Burkholderiales bacterium]
MIAVLRVGKSAVSGRAAPDDEQAWFKQLFELSPDPTWIIEGNQFIECNEAAVKTLGYSNRAELLNVHPSKLSPQTQPDGQNSYEKAERIFALVQTNGLHRFEWTHTRADGTDFVAEVTLSTIELSDRQVIYCIWRDITERKVAEEAQRIAAATFESQQGTFITDANKVILRVNKAFTSVTGYTAQEAVGQTPGLLKSGRQNAAFYAAMWDSISRTGTWLGEIWNRRKNGTVYPEHLSISSVKDDAGILTHYVGTFSDLTSYKAAEEQIDDLAHTDLLTGMSNRRKLIIRLQQAIVAAEDHQHQCALLMLDLDYFKSLNDAIGHAQGDEVLHCVAKRLAAATRDDDTVARLGGDEFVVLLDHLNRDPQVALRQVQALANKMLEALNTPYQLSGSTISCTASIGITFFGAQHEDTLEPLKRAELALYQAKSGGRNMLRFFDPQMQAVVDARVKLAAALQEAIQNQQFTLYYQAQVSDSDGIVGVEALVRWFDPKRGMVSPAEFIPLAEETGLILPIGSWVLETACQQLAAWAAQPAMAHLSIAVNVSARQFRESNFVSQT